MSRATRLYRRLVRAFLGSVLDAAEQEELVELFRALRSRARRGSVVARALLWPRILADLCWTAGAERMGSFQGATAGGGGGGRPLRAWIVGSAVQAMRVTARRPAHTLVASLTIALGVGAGTLVVVLGRDVLLRPLPFADSERLVRLRELDDQRRPWWPSRRNFEDWRAAAPPAVEGIEAAGVPQPLPVLVGEVAVRSRVAEASRGFFELLGARFHLGRAPSADEASAQGSPVAVVSHRFWTEALGSRPLQDTDVVVGVGRFPVVGVLDPDFGFIGDGAEWEHPDVWLPMERTADAGRRRSHGIHVVARARPGVSLAQADRELDAMAAAVATTHAEPTDALSVLTTPLEADVLGPARRPLGFLFGSAMCVLLVAGLNLAGRFLVDGIARRQDLAVRQALGGSRGQIVGQLLAEAVVAAVPGALGGFGIAWAGLALAKRLDPTALPRFESAAVDPTTFLVAATAATVLAATAATLPGMLLTGPRATGRVASLGRGRTRRGLRGAWNAILVVQVALTFSLLVGTAALVRNLVAVLRSDLGFDPAGVTALQISLPESRYAADDARVRYIEESLGVLRSMPGVAAASITDMLPHVTQARISGTTRVGGDPERFSWAGVRVVDAAYFEVLAVPVLGGEFPLPGEATRAMVDASLRDGLLGGEALGARVTSGMTRGDVTVSGVVGAVREWDLQMGDIGTVYLDFRSAPDRLLDAYLLVRVADGALVPPGELRRAVRSVDDQVPVAVEPLEAAMARTLGSRRLVLVMTAAFGLLGVVFACVGVHGIVAFLARIRARDSGVRLALGARPAQLRARAVAHGLAPTLAGVTGGALVALASARLIRSRVEGLDSLGAASFASAALLLLAVATVAAYLPARRMARVDLTSILRDE